MKLPENFVPLIVIGEVDGYLTIFTGLGNEDVLEILEQTHVAIEEDGYDENVVATLQ